MKKKNLKARFLISAVILFALVPLGCGEEDSGGITFQIAWNIPASVSFAPGFKPQALPSGVVSLRVTVSGSDMNNKVKTFRNLDPAGGFIDVTGIKPGDNRTVLLEGLNSIGGITYRGQISGITVVKGEVTDTGTIIMDPVASDNAPASPSALTATVISSSQITLSWTDNSDNETGFKLERREGSSGSWSEFAQAVTDVASYTDAGLTCETQYYYRVRAFNDSGNSGYSNEANATTDACPASVPADPSNLQATAFSSTQINLSWTDNANNEDGFKIERRIGTTGNYTSAGTVGTGVNSYQDTGLTCDTTYYYRVRAFNGAGDSGNSNQVNATTSACASTSWLAAKIAAGGQHTCAITSGGSVRCWGWNEYGQLGNGTNTSSNTPVEVSGITTATQIVAGTAHTCAQLSDYTVKCWGWNNNGQLGNGTNTSSYIPVAVTGITTAAEVSAGGNHTCARLTDNTIKCWGANDKGQLGNKTYTSSTTPVDVSGITTAAEIAAGGTHTCARMTTLTIQCWGGNSDGQLGNGTITNSNTPLAVPGIIAAQEISAGLYHTCARGGDNSVQCWGRNNYGQLGIGTYSTSTTPAKVSGIMATEISAGGEVISANEYSHTCARITDNTIKCWGRNNYGQLGTGSNMDYNNPVTLSGISGAAEISTGGAHTCIRLTDKTIKCVGWNTNGQLGNGTNTSSNNPVYVVGTEP